MKLIITSVHRPWFQHLANILTVYSLSQLDIFFLFIQKQQILCRINFQSTHIKPELKLIKTFEDQDQWHKILTFLSSRMWVKLLCDLTVSNPQMT